MGHLQAVYVRHGIGELNQLADAVRVALRPERSLAGRPVLVRAHAEYCWLQVQVADTRDLHELAAFLSRSLRREVVALELYTVVDFFAYSRWSSGHPHRKLVYGDPEEGLWSVVEGQPEAWEDSVLFHADDLGQFSGRVALDRQALLVYRARRVRSGAHLPFVSTRCAGREIAEALQLPGFPKDLQPGSRPAYWSLEKTLLRPSLRDYLNVLRLFRSESSPPRRRDA